MEHPTHHSRTMCDVAGGTYPVPEQQHKHIFAVNDDGDRPHDGTGAAPNPDGRSRYGHQSVARSLRIRHAAPAPGIHRHPPRRRAAPDSLAGRLAAVRRPGTPGMRAGVRIGEVEQLAGCVVRVATLRAMAMFAGKVCRREVRSSASSGIAACGRLVRIRRDRCVASCARSGYWKLGCAAGRWMPNARLI